MRPHDSGREVPAWARAIDLIVLALLILALVVATTGGYRGRAFGLRISVTREWKIFIWAGLLWAVRHWRIPRHPVLRRVGPREPDDTVFKVSGTGAQTLGLAAGSTFLTAMMTWPQILEIGSVPDHGDPLFSTWRLAWVAHQLLIDPRHLFDANIFYPEPRTLTLSDPTIVPALMAAPLLWLGTPPIAGYNVVVVSAFALTALFTFLFVRALVGGSGAAAVAAIIFAFYPYRFDQYSHIEQMTCWVPLGAWAFHRTLERGRLRDGLLTGLAIAAQLLSSAHHGLFFIAFLVPVGVVLWWARRPPVGTTRVLMGGALLAVVLVAPVAVSLWESRGVVGERPVAEVEYYSARPTDYLSPHPRNAMWGWLSDSYTPERCLFPGVLPIALAIVGLWPPLSATRLAYAAALGVAFDLSLGFNGVLYEALYTYVFPYRGLRVPARFGLLVGFALAVCAAYGVKRVARHLEHPTARLVLIAFVVLLLIELHPSLNLIPVWAQPPPVYQRIEPNAVVAEFPAPSEISEVGSDARYMYFSTFHWRRLINGYSGFFPASYLEFMTRMRAFPGADSLAYLKMREVDYLVLHGAFMDPAAYASVRGTLDASPDVSLVERFTWEEREGSVYRVRR